MNLLYYKNKYFENEILVNKNEILDHFRNFGIKNNYSIDSDYESIDYLRYNSIDLLKIVCDKLFFFKVDNQSIKNLMYKFGLIYQDFKNENQIESYLYRLVREKQNRVLIFTGSFDIRNSEKKITDIMKNELIQNLNHDVIFLSKNIILIRHQIFLSWLWKCRENPIENLYEFNDKYFLENQWNFSNYYYNG